MDSVLMLYSYMGDECPWYLPRFAKKPRFFVVVVAYQWRLLNCGEKIGGWEKRYIIGEGVTGMWNTGKAPAVGKTKGRGSADSSYEGD